MRRGARARSTIRNLPIRKARYAGEIRAAEAEIRKGPPEPELCMICGAPSDLVVMGDPFCKEHRPKPAAGDRGMSDPTQRHIHDPRAGGLYVPGRFYRDALRWRPERRRRLPQYAAAGAAIGGAAVAVRSGAGADEALYDSAFLANCTKTSAPSSDCWPSRIANSSSNAPPSARWPHMTVPISRRFIEWLLTTTRIFSNS